MINNWAVWSGHGTKAFSIDCKARGRGSTWGQHTTTPAWRRSWNSPPSSAAVARSPGCISSSLSARRNSPVTTSTTTSTSQSGNLRLPPGRRRRQHEFSPRWTPVLVQGSCLVSPPPLVHPRYLVVQPQPLWQIEWEWSIACVSPRYSRHENGTTAPSRRFGWKQRGVQGIFSQWHQSLIVPVVITSALTEHNSGKCSTNVSEASIVAAIDPATHSWPDGSCRFHLPIKSPRALTSYMLFLPFSFKMTCASMQNATRSG